LNYGESGDEAHRYAYEVGILPLPRRRDIYASRRNDPRNSAARPTVR